MKTQTKRWVSLLLVLVLVFSLTGCFGGSEEEKGEDGGKQAKTEEGKGETGEKTRLTDLGGMEIKIGDWYYVEPEEPNQYQKDTQAYREKIMKDYNFKISRDGSAYAFQDIQETYVTQVMSDSPKYSLYYLYQDCVAAPLLKGLMYNLSSIPTINLKEEKWNPLVNDLMTFGENQYGMSTEHEPRGGIFFNKRLLEEAGIDPDEPYDLQQSGQWTWEKFEEYCKKLTKDTDNDGEIDQYAMASFSKTFLPAAVANNDGQFIGREENGHFTNEISSDNFLKAANWGMDIVKKYVMPKPKAASTWDWYKAAFRDGQVAMQTGEVYETTSFKNMDDEWGYVMFPYNQENKGATNKTIPNDNIVVIPSCYDAETAEKIAFAYDLYTEATPNYDYDDVYKEGYYTMFKDSRAVDETLMMMKEEEHKSVSYLPMIGKIDYGDFCYGVYAGSVTPAKQVDKIKSQWDSYIRDINNNYDKFKANNK